MRDAKAVITSFVLLVLVLSLTIGIAPVQAITWGDVDSSNEYANVGAIIIQYDGNYAIIGSGTLVSSTKFLTAAHCTYYLDYLMFTNSIDNIYVSFDPTDPLTHLDYEVDDIISHPDYNPNTNRPDVGLLILKDDVSDIDPANLAEDRYLDTLLDEGELRQRGRSSKFIAVGYGGTLAWPPPVIQENDDRYFTDDAGYQALLPNWLLLSQNPKRGYGGTCYGDSGGPIFWEADGTLVLVAVTSWGDYNCITAGFNFRIDNQEILDFIADPIA